MPEPSSAEIFEVHTFVDLIVKFSSIQLNASTPAELVFKTRKSRIKWKVLKEHVGDSVLQESLVILSPRDN